MGRKPKNINYADGYSEEKLEKLRKKFGEELTYSTYRMLRDLGLQNDDIAKMYKISKTTLHNFVKAHKDVLGA